MRAPTNERMNGRDHEPNPKFSALARWGALLTSLVNGWGGETTHATAERARAALRYIEFDEEVG